MSLYIGGSGGKNIIRDIAVGSNDETVKLAKRIYIGDENSKPVLIFNKDNIDSELSTVNPIELLTSGRITSFDIGKTVYLSNSCLASQEWIIVDVNHDDTIGTVDLIMKYSDNECGIDNNEYYISVPRYASYDIPAYFNDDIMRALASFEINSGKYTLHDIIKIPSVTELGIAPPNDSVGEGNVYPVFGKSLLEDTNAAAIKLDSSQQPSEYWTRTVTSDLKTMRIDNTGTALPIDGDETGYNAYMIRFKTKPSNNESKEEMFTHTDNYRLFKKGVINRNDIGKTLILTNAAIAESDNPCMQWTIAGIDHDGTEDTIDLITTNLASNCSGLNSSSYESSGIREYINADGIDSFDSNIQNLLVSCGSISKGVDLGDKIKVISYEELGINVTGCTDCAGSKYPIFDYVEGAETNESCKGLDFLMSACEYHVRNYSLSASADNKFPGVDINGNPAEIQYGSQLMLAIRIKCY